MLAQFTPFTPILLLVGAGMIAMGTFVVPWKRLRSAQALAFLAIMVGVWAISYGLELMRGDQAWIAFWLRVEYIGIVAVSPGWLLFAAAYGGRDHWMQWRRLLLLFLLPCITLVAAWTNDLHGLLWSQIRIAQQGDLMLFNPIYGAWFWIHTIYSYLCLIGGSVLLLYNLRHMPGQGRRAVFAMIVAMAAPLLGNVVYLLELGPFAYIDSTPLAFAVSCIAATLAILRLHLFDLMPIARSTVAEQISDGIVVLNDRQMLVDLNPSAAKTLNKPLPGLVGRHAADVFAAWPDLVARLKLLTREDTLLIASGEHSWLSLRLTPILDTDGQIRGTLIVWRDVSAERQTEAALRSAKETAEAANRAKSAFLANVSHELRTPLTAILGYSQLMQIRISQREYDSLTTDALAIEQAGNRLLDQIRNLLQLAQIEAGTIPFQPVEVPVVDVLDDVIMAGNAMAMRRNNRLVSHISGEAGMIRTDPTRLHEALLHLVDNAAKFTESGTITLSYERVRSHQGDYALFQVSDTGIGIGASELSHLFTMFGEPDEQKRRIYGGMGVGLAISFQISRLLGGELAVSSTPGHGATFTIRLPVNGPPESVLAV